MSMTFVLKHGESVIMYKDLQHWSSPIHHLYHQAWAPCPKKTDASTAHFSLPTWNLLGLRIYSFVPKEETRKPQKQDLAFDDQN